MSYTRVLPRDLFNEAKLLKCMAQLALLIHDEKGIRWPLRLEHDTFIHQGFDIEQDATDGGLYCTNLHLFCGPVRLAINCPYNNREPYPLLFACNNGELPVFDNKGQFSAEFTDWLDWE